MNIRKAKSSDMSEVYQMICELALFEKEPDEVHIKESTLIKDGFQTTPPLFEVFIAEEEGRVLGMALYYYRYSTWKGRSLHLEDLIVKEAFRKKGVGTQLFQKVVKEAYIQRVGRMEWAVLSWNSTALGFYQKAGATVFKDWRIAQMNTSQIEKYIANLAHK